MRVKVISPVEIFWFTNSNVDETIFSANQNAIS